MNALALDISSHGSASHKRGVVCQGARRAQTLTVSTCQVPKRRAKYHVVKRGEAASQIAKKYGLTWAEFV